MKTLITEVSSYSQLELAWESVKKNKKASPGIDQQTLENFSKNLKANLIKISKELKESTYQFSPALEARIPKKTKNDFRKINVFNLKDKIVQKSLQLTLDRKRKQGRFFPNIRNSISIGFLSKRDSKDVVGVPKALDVIKQNYKKGYTVITTADIKDFFPSIDIKKLYKVIEDALPDNTINKLIKDCLTPEVMERDRFDKNSFHALTASGVAQGSILSPLFSNIYLMDFDKSLEKNKIIAVRYADDVLILSTVPTKSEEMFQKVREILKTTSSLDFYPKGTDKEPKHYPLKRGGRYLGLQIQFKKNRWEIYPIPQKVSGLIKNIHDELNPEKHGTFLERVYFLELSINSWFNTYIKMGCTKKIISDIHKTIEQAYYDDINKLLVDKGIIEKFIHKNKLQFLTNFRFDKKRGKRY